MLAELKHILIEVNQLKIGYIVRNNGLFGIVSDIDIPNNKAVVSFTDGTTDTYTIAELKYCVVKFLAVMKDLNSFPIIHGDFITIINNFETREKVEKLVKGAKVTIEGTLQNIATLPKKGDVVEITSLKVAEKYNMLSNRSDRIGFIQNEKITNGKFVIEFPSRTTSLRRSEFDILNGLNNKQVFKLDDKFK